VPTFNYVKATEATHTTTHKHTHTHTHTHTHRQSVEVTDTKVSVSCVGHKLSQKLSQVRTQLSSKSKIHSFNANCANRNS